MAFFLIGGRACRIDDDGHQDRDHDGGRLERVWPCRESARKRQHHVQRAPVVGGAAAQPVVAGQPQVAGCANPAAAASSPARAALQFLALRPGTAANDLATAGSSKTIRETTIVSSAGEQKVGGWRFAKPRARHWQPLSFRSSTINGEIEMNRAISLALAASLLVTTPAQARDPRLVEMFYDADQVVRIEGRTNVQATIQSAKTSGLKTLLLAIHDLADHAQQARQSAVCETPCSARLDQHDCHHEHADLSV